MSIASLTLQSCSPGLRHQLLGAQSSVSVRGSGLFPCGFANCAVLHLPLFTLKFTLGLPRLSAHSPGHSLEERCVIPCGKLPFTLVSY